MCTRTAGQYIIIITAAVARTTVYFTGRSFYHGCRKKYSLIDIRTNKTRPVYRYAAVRPDEWRSNASRPKSRNHVFGHFRMTGAGAGGFRIRSHRRRDVLSPSPVRRGVLLSQINIGFTHTIAGGGGTAGKRSLILYYLFSPGINNDETGNNMVTFALLLSRARIVYYTRIDDNPARQPYVPRVAMHSYLSYIIL